MSNTPDDTPARDDIAASHDDHAAPATPGPDDTADADGATHDGAVGSDAGGADAIEGGTVGGDAAAGGAARGAAGDDAQGMSFGAKIRYTIYAILLVTALGVLVWQWMDDGRNWIIGGLYEATPEELKAASTPEAPIYWLGPNAIPGDEVITYTLSDKEKGLAKNVRGAVFYLPPDLANPDPSTPEKPMTTFANVYTRPLDAPARQSLDRVKRSCDAGDCMLSTRRIATRFGPAYVEPSPTGGWIGRVAIDDRSLVIVTAGNDMTPEADVFNALYPIDGTPPRQ